MSMFDRLLVPLDGSPRAEAVLGQLGLLLQGAELVLVRAIRASLPLRGEAFPSMLGEERREAERYLEDVARRLDAQGVQARWTLAEGDPAEAVLRVAASESCTLIALSTHGRSGLARWALGSTAERVVRGADRPVLLLRSFAAGAPQIRRILAPTDGSPASEAVVPAVVELARLFGAEVVALHVERPLVSTSGSTLAGPWVVPSSAAPPPASSEAAERAELFRRAGLNARAESASGDPASRILDAAGELGADLIALSTHGRSGLTRWLLGSVTEKVLRGAELPLLIVRARD